MIDIHSGFKMIFVIEPINWGNYAILVSFRGTEYRTIYIVIFCF